MICCYYLHVIPQYDLVHYNKVKEGLGCGLSHRDFNGNLKSMVEEKVVIKKDGTEKRGDKVYYIF